MDYDKTDIARTYARARNHGPEFLQQWMDVLSKQLKPGDIRTILDLGCGTGRFSEALAQRFDAMVVGIDPSSKMLGEAVAAVRDPRVRFARGIAEAIPLNTGSVDLVFLSMVFHHFTDPLAVATECRRVLRADGRVSLRTGSREKIPLYPYVPYFPGTVPLLEQRLPPLKAQCQAFEAASLEVVFAGEVIQQVAPDFPSFTEKVALRADSTLVSLDDRQFEAGLAAMRAETKNSPVVEPIDFVVFAR